MSIPVLFPVSVFLRCGMSCIARGTVQGRRDVVHGYPVLEHESIILINEIFDKDSELFHPTYNYEISVGGFTSWNDSDLVFN